MEKSIKSFSVAVSLFVFLLISSGCSKTAVLGSGVVSGNNNDNNSYSPSETQYLVTTLADHLLSPQGLTLDGQGNLYITSSNEGSIQKITPYGSMTTLSVNRSFGASVMGTLEGITLDEQGNLYYTDMTNEVIGRIASSGELSTLAGDNSTGNSDGVGGAAQFNRPYGIAMDKQGNLYVADAGNSEIRKIANSGMVSTLNLNSTQTSEGGKTIYQGLGRPEGICIDELGNLYVTDVEHAAILKITSSGTVTTIAGGLAIGYADGAGPSARFNRPLGIVIDHQGNLYVADAGNGAIRKINTSGMVTTIAGGRTIGFADGIGGDAEFDSPEAIAIDSQGILYVSDGCYGAVRKIVQQ